GPPAASRRACRRRGRRRGAGPAAGPAPHHPGRPPLREPAGAGRREGSAAQARRGTRATRPVDGCGV
ncbi:MAG: hypothetical protein AVDCRST_MAG76-3438, partial [uncultured Acidimicrobiales bacterium]